MITKTWNYYKNFSHVSFDKFRNFYLFWTLQSKVNSPLEQCVSSTGFGFWIRIHFRKVVSTSIGYRFKILNLYPIQGHTDTIFETWIQSHKKNTDTNYFLNPIQIRKINKYKILICIWIFLDWIFIFKIQKSKSNPNSPICRP